MSHRLTNHSEPAMKAILTFIAVAVLTFLVVTVLAVPLVHVVRAAVSTVSRELTADK